MLDILLQPIIWFINQYSYTKKFIMLTLLFISALIMPIYHLNNYVGSSNSFSEKEILGIRYIMPVKRFLFSMNAYESMLTSNPGNPPSIEILDELWNVLQKEELRDGQALDTKQSFDELKTEFMKLRDKADSIPVSARFPLTDVVDQKISALLNTTAIHSNLVLDSDADSYYVMDTIILRLPALDQEVSAYQQLANDILNKKSISSQDQEALITLKTNIKNAFELTKSNLESSVANTKDKALFNEFSQAFEAYESSINDYTDYIYHGVSNLSNTSYTTSLYHSKINSLADQTTISASKLFDIGSDCLVKLIQARIEQTSTPWMFTLIISVVVLLLIFYFMVGFRMSVVQTVNDLRRASEDLASGDLTTRLQICTKDELSYAGIAFNQVAESFNHLIGEVQTSANNVTNASETLSATSVQMQHEAESLSELSKTANQLTDSVDNSIKTVAAAVEQSSANINEVSSVSVKVGQNIQFVQSSAEAVSSKMQSIADSASEMSSSVNTVASAIEEMSASLNEVSMSAAQAAKVATLAESTAQATSETVNILGTSAKEIENVLGVIKDIASQTNLLALNATIEAASAGEAGKGFAVVANEVKELAKRSAEAAEDIRQRIENMQSNTNAAVNAIEQILTIISEISHINNTIASAVEEQTATVNEISRSVSGAAQAAKDVTLNVQEAAETSASVSSQVNEANRSVALITTNIAELAQGANEISKGAGEAANSASQMAGQVEQVNKTSLETEHEASSLNLTAQELASLAANLKNMVERFKIAV